LRLDTINIVQETSKTPAKTGISEATNVIIRLKNFKDYCCLPLITVEKS
jgi:hypothetical protein